MQRANEPTWSGDDDMAADDPRTRRSKYPHDIVERAMSMLEEVDPATGSPAYTYAQITAETGVPHGTHIEWRKAAGMPERLPRRPEAEVAATEERQQAILVQLDRMQKQLDAIQALLVAALRDPRN